MAPTYSPEFNYLFELIRYRINKSIDAANNQPEPVRPLVNDWNKHLAAFIDANELSGDASLLLLIAMAPYVYPHLFDDAVGEQFSNLNFPKIGGTHGKNFRGFFAYRRNGFFYNFRRRCKKKECRTTAIPGR